MEQAIGYTGKDQSRGDNEGAAETVDQTVEGNREQFWDRLGAMLQSRPAGADHERRLGPSLSWMALLAVWAPTTSLAAAVAAALTAMTAVWATALFWSRDFDTAKAVAMSTGLCAYALFMVVFATAASFSDTLKRLGISVRLLIGVLGIFGLMSAGALVVEYFTGTSMLN